ncbi:MAG: hypothetical protein HY791_19100 [Deltaproteobacteria bacterium]|nr:hypothetical protein [Deltaproteobacteria bacterium]
MTKLDHLRPNIVAELKRRAIEPGADIQSLVEEFSEAPGSRILYSEGDGEVSLWVPARDGFETPEKIRVAPIDNPGNVLDEVKKGRTLEVDGIGKFHEFVLSPLRYKKKAQKADEPKALAEIGFQGTTKAGGYWSPLGFEDSWFAEDFPLLLDLAAEGGMALRPNAEEDGRDTKTKKLTKTEREFMSLVLGRTVPEVVHESVIEEALEKVSSDDGVTAGAVRSLTMSLGKAATVAAGPSDSPLVMSGARLVLQKLLGAEALDPAGFPANLVKLAEEILEGAGRMTEASALKQLIKGEEVGKEDVDAALDLAFGAGFASTRSPTLALVDRLIDGYGSKLEPEEVGRLRDLREQIDAQLEAELFGDDLAQKPLANKTAEKKVNELLSHLREGTSLDGAALATLAHKLTAALNIPSTKPSVIVLAGGSSGSIETVFNRSKALLGESVISIQASTDLRNSDPVGILVGSPADEPGIAKGVLVHEAPKSGRFTAAIHGLEGVGKSCTKAEDRAAAVRSFWTFVSDAERDGWFKGYDPNDPKKALGTKLELAGGVLLLRTTQTVSELEASLPPELWSRVSAKVIDLGKTSADGAVSAIRQGLENHLEAAFGLEDADVELSDASKAFFRDLFANGVKAEDVETRAIQEISPKIHFAAVDGELTPRIRVDLAKGLTSKERAKLRDDWMLGRSSSLVGLGGSAFAIFDAGTRQLKKSKISPKLERAKAESKELDRLRAIVAEYQLGAFADEKKIRALVEENRKTHGTLDAAEGHIGDLKWLNERAVWEIEDLKRLNDLAQKTIGILQSDLGKANAKIESQNATIGTLKDAGKKLEQAAKTAIAERDAIDATLKRVETQFNSAIKALGTGAGSFDPNLVFALIAATPRDPAAGKYLDALLQQMLVVATSRALERAMGQARRFDKFEDIAQLAARYVAASQAIGQAPDRRVLDGFERAARLSGNGWSTNLAQDWQARVGLPAGQANENEGLMGYLTRNLLRRFGVRI